MPTDWISSGISWRFHICIRILCIFPSCQPHNNNHNNNALVETTYPQNPLKISMVGVGEMTFSSMSFDCFGLFSGRVHSSAWMSCQVYSAIPFLNELRVITDWTVTETLHELVVWLQLLPWGYSQFFGRAFLFVGRIIPICCWRSSIQVWP